MDEKDKKKDAKVSKFLRIELSKYPLNVLKWNMSENNSSREIQMGSNLKNRLIVKRRN